MIPYGRQDINQDDIESVVAVLQSDWITQGSMVPRFEAAVANKVGSTYAIAVNSATSALHLACLALDLGPGDWLWTSPITFVASANCGVYCGAQVDFVDIDPQTYNMSVIALRHKLEQSERLGTLPKIVVPVHFTGQSCDMIEIHRLAQQYGFKIIEDASHAIGGHYNGRLIGCSAYSDITVFSFHPVKIMTTGEGGMALTPHERLAERMLRLRSHGITRDPDQMTGVSPGAWYYEQCDLGFNFRMTDIQAALGLSQLNRLDEFVLRRQNIALEYNHALADLPLLLPFQHQQTNSAFHLYVIQVLHEDIGLARDTLFEQLRQAGIGVNVHYIPVHLQPYYQNRGYSVGDFPEAERYYHRTISLPMYVTLSKEDQMKVIQALRVNLYE